MRILSLAMVTILTVACLTACGGGGDEKENDENAPAAAGTPTAAAAGTARATATVAATATAKRTPTATAKRTPTPTGEAFGSLSGLDSYRYTMTMDLKGLGSALTESFGGLTGEESGTMPETIHMEIVGAFVAPDKAEANMSIGGLTDEISMTVIGDQQWMKWGDMVMGPDTFEGDLSDMSLAEAMWGSFEEGASGLTCSSEKKETVNGGPSVHCGIDEASFEELASLFGETETTGDIDELSLDLWLAEDGGWPVRLQAHVAGTDESGQDMEAELEMDITDVNEEIGIEPPR
ncbi:MAG: hypothetical protein MUP14_04460 [Dehalococcoidia bacterium]|nr:hypothetical protein [Dehalococcoidia bacterium]